MYLTSYSHYAIKHKQADLFNICQYNNLHAQCALGHIPKTAAFYRLDALSDANKESNLHERE